MSDPSERPTPPDDPFEDVDTYLQFIGPCQIEQTLESAGISTR